MGWKNKGETGAIYLDPPLLQRLKTQMQIEGRYDLNVFVKEQILKGMAQDDIALGHAHIEIAKRRVYSVLTSALNGHVRTAFQLVSKDLAKMSTDPRSYLQEHERNYAAQDEIIEEE